MILAPSSAHRGHPSLSIGPQSQPAHPPRTLTRPLTALPPRQPRGSPGAAALRNWPGSGHGTVLPPQPGCPLPVSSAQDRRLSEGPPRPCWLPAGSAHKRPWTQEAGSRGRPCLLLFPTCLWAQRSQLAVPLGVTQTLRGTHRWASPRGSHGEGAGEGQQVCVGGDKQLPCMRLTAIRAHPEACGPRNQT